MTQENKMIKTVLRDTNRNASVLEVGSGYGHKLRFLQSIGFSNLVGVEKNEALVERVRRENMRVFAIAEFEREFAGTQFDVIVLSHIIEHFQYNELKTFLEYYLAYLKENGVLVVATPILNDSFYDDYDHVKPYSHLGLQSVFGADTSQVQFYSKYQLRLLDLRFIRLSYQLKYYRALALRTPLYRFPRLINQLLHLVYRISFRLIGRPVAWVGVFEKTIKQSRSGDQVQTMVSGDSVEA